MITYQEGDATAIERGILVHVCNDVGKRGAGFTRALSRRWPALRFCIEGPKPLGVLLRMEVQEDPSIVVFGMVAQRGVGRGVDRIHYTMLTRHLRYVFQQATETRQVVHMPRIGCGLAGSTWPKILTCIENANQGLDAHIVVWDPPAQGSERP